MPVLNKFSGLILLLLFWKQAGKEGAMLWWAGAHGCLTEKCCPKVAHHRQYQRPVTKLNLGKHFENRHYSSAWITIAWTKAKIPMGAALNRLILQLSVSSQPISQLCISICLHISKHKGSSNPNPTTFIHMSEKPLHTTELPKITITLTLITSVWNEVKYCCSGSEGAALTSSPGRAP